MKKLFSVVIILFAAVMLPAKAPDVEVSYRRMVNAGEYVEFKLSDVSGNAEPFQARFILENGFGEKVYTSQWVDFSGRERRGFCCYLDTLPWAANDHLILTVEIKQHDRISRYRNFAPIQVEVAGNYDSSRVCMATSRLADVRLKREGNTVTISSEHPVLRAEWMYNGRNIHTIFAGVSENVSGKIPDELSYLPGCVKVTLTNAKVWYSEPAPAMMTRDIRRVRVWHERFGRAETLMTSGSRLRTMPFKRKVSSGTFIVSESLISGLTAFTFQCEIEPENIAGKQLIAERRGFFQLRSDNGRLILYVRSQNGDYLKSESRLHLIPGKRQKLVWRYDFTEQSLSLGDKTEDCRFVRIKDKLPSADLKDNFNGTISNCDISFMI